VLPRVVHSVGHKVSEADAIAGRRVLARFEVANSVEPPAAWRRGSRARADVSGARVWASCRSFPASSGLPDRQLPKGDYFPAVSPPLGQRLLRVSGHRLRTSAKVRVAANYAKDHRADPDGPRGVPWLACQSGVLPDRRIHASPSRCWPTRRRELEAHDSTTRESPRIG